jgi:hypothetical protein
VTDDPTKDLFPETEPREVVITEPVHIMLMGETHGYMGAHELLLSVPDSRRTPGFALALAMIGEAANAKRADMISRNLRLVAKAGIDVGSVQRIDSLGSKLICYPFAPGDEP